MSNCTFAQNIASTGRTLRCRSYGQDYPVTVSLTNCVLWSGGDEIRSLAGSTVEIRYSDVQGGQAGIHDPCETITWGQGNIDVDPGFADPGYWDANETLDDPNDDFFVEGDYHLKSEVGRWNPNGGRWVEDDVTSPCIDTGDPNSDVLGEVWPHGGRINMGAYGGTREASLSAEPTEMFLPHVVYLHWHDQQKAESFQSFLQAHGCSVTLIRSDLMTEPSLDDCDLVVIGTDTQNPAAWPDEQSVATLADAGRPIVGLGDGGYRFFGKLGLAIGYPNGASGRFNSVSAVDSDSSVFQTPYPVGMPEDQVLQVYSGTTDCVMIYLWPAPLENVTALGRKVDDQGYYPLVAEQGHLLWGFVESPDQMTEAGKRLFLNAVILTANGLLEPKIAQAP